MNTVKVITNECDMEELKGEDKKRTGTTIDTKDKVPAEKSDTDEGSGQHNTAPRSRRCKARRARRKAYLPYYQLSEEERILREENERLRLVKLRDRMKAKGRIIAPYNTTQFLMADHHDDTLQQIEAGLELKNAEK